MEGSSQELSGLNRQWIYQTQILSAGAGGSPPTCAINSPTAGATVGGLVLMDFDALDNGTSVQVDFAFDAGSGFGVMTAAGSSPGGQSLCSTFPRPR